LFRFSIREKYYNKIPNISRVHVYNIKTALIKQRLRMYWNKLALRLGWKSMARFNGEFESGLPQKRYVKD